MKAMPQLVPEKPDIDVISVFAAPVGYQASWPSFPGHPADKHSMLAERRKRILEMLIAGDRFVDIDNTLGLYPKSARKYLRFLSPEQKTMRDRKVADRRAIGSEIISMLNNATFIDRRAA